MQGGLHLTADQSAHSAILERACLGCGSPLHLMVLLDLKVGWFSIGCEWKGLHPVRLGSGFCHLARCTATHGVDVGDLPALALLLVAACLAI
jgi:hypothetical protein